MGRGGHSGPNYEPQYVKECTDILRKDGANPRIIVDCSHGNSRKIHTNQPIVAKSITDACVDVPSTDVLLSGLAEGVRTRRAMNRSGKGSMKADSLPIK